MPSPSLVKHLGALVVLVSAQAMASGFGAMHNATVLGSRLDMTVPLRLDAGQTIEPECVSAEVLAGDSRVASSAVNVAVVAGRDADERLIRIGTDAAIDEPVVTVTLRAGCTSPITRRFVALVDPPLAAARAAAPQDALPAVAATAAPNDPPLATRGEADIGTSTPAAATPADTRRTASAPRKAAHERKHGSATASAARTASRGAPRKTASAASAKPRKAAPRAAAAAPAVPVAPPAILATAAKGPRLQLDAAALDVLLASAPLRLADALPPLLPAAAAATPGAASAAAAEIAAQRERLGALEGSLAKLRSDSQATQASLVQLRAELRESQAQRFANPLVYALLALCVLLGAAAALLWRSRAAARRQMAQWWAPAADAVPAAAAAAATYDAAADAALGAASGSRAVPREHWQASDSIHGETTASPRLLEAVASEPAAAERRPEMTVDELIDLEQQADFFVVLGQDDAAIDLLLSHLYGSGGTTPLPYLKLLEIHRRLGDRDAYERMRERFNDRFNAYAPDWDCGLRDGKSLQDDAPVIEKLQSLWASPQLAMRTLESSLLRRDPQASTFDLPAYRELLFLYSIARDLSEHEARHAGVDVVLPFAADASEAETLTPLHPTRPTTIAADAGTTRVDVDITSLDPAAAVADDRPSRDASEFGTTSADVHLPIERFAASR